MKISKKEYYYLLDSIIGISQASFNIKYEFKIKASEIDNKILEHINDLIEYASFEEEFDTSRVLECLNEAKEYFNKFQENWNNDNMTVCGYKPVIALIKQTKKAIRTAKKI